MKQTVLEKFLRYAKIDTQSQDETGTTPSTQKQFDLGNLLVEELKALGLDDVKIDDHCYVTATLKSNVPTDHPAYGKVPAIGFLAHVDTSPEVSGKDVKPQIIENYQGGDIKLPNGEITLKTEENPALEKCIGHTIITTDGTTLLGSDDKSGVAGIMTALEYWTKNPEAIHGDIRVSFTPDEEIGQGTKFFDLEGFNCEYAYTLDGEMPGELNKETFSANSAIVTVKGRDIHPGAAKDIMVNSIRVMADIIAMMPKLMAPETTEGYEPYIHPYILEGGVGKSTLKILFRDFITAGLDDQKKIMENIIEVARKMHPKAEINLEIIEMYRNMRDSLEEKPEGCDYLWEAAVASGVEPHWSPIRGGTDGSRLTEMGLPCPNIYTGGQNFHSKTEWMSADALVKAVETIINLGRIWVEKKS